MAVDYGKYCNAILLVGLVFQSVSVEAKSRRAFALRNGTSGSYTVGTRTTAPPMLVTFFRAPSSPPSEPKVAVPNPRSSLFLGGGFLGAIARDSATFPGSVGLSYGGAAVSLVWQPQTAWLVRFGLGYVTRTFRLDQDPTGGQGQVGQYWSANLAIEYEWLHAGALRVSSGWAHQLSLGYRSRDFFTPPTFAKLWYFKTGFSTLGRYELSQDIDVYVDAQWLLGIGRPWESQGTLGAGIIFGLE
jgi:hypothetical protein